MQRWTAKRRTALIVSIIKGETSVAEAAHKHGLAVTVSLLVAVPFVAVYMTAGFIMEALFAGIPPRRSHGSDWTRPPG